MNKISVFFEHLVVSAKQSNLPIEEVLKQAKDSGVDLLEISFDDYFYSNANYYKTLFVNARMSVSCFCANFDLLNDSDEVTKEKYTRVFETALLFNCKTVLCVPGFFSENDNIDEKTQLLCKRLSNMCQSAKNYGICVTIEDFDNKNSPCCTTEQINHLLENVDGLKCTFDIGNFSYCEDDISKSYQILKNHIVHVHLKDRIVSTLKPVNIDVSLQENKNGKIMYTTPTGEGELQISRWIKQLNKDGYNGVFTIEHFGLDNQLKAVKKSAKNVICILNCL